MFDLLQVSGGKSEATELIAQRLQLAYPRTAEVPNLSHLIEMTLSVAKQVTGNLHGQVTKPQHFWLFELAGRLKGALPNELRNQEELGVILAPLALLFVDQVEALRAMPRKGRIEWTDKDAVLLEFDEIWSKRKFPKGSPFLDEGIAFALTTPLPITGNVHFVRVLSVAYYLQNKQLELPILLPINPAIAAKLGTTPVTLGTAISKAVREGYLHIVDGHFDIKAGKARSFRFNFDHPMIEAIRKQVPLGR